MKISVIGAGAMGSLFGGLLSKSGHKVILYDINKEHVGAVNTHGLIIEDAATGKESVCRPVATVSPDALGDSEIAVIFVKSLATRAVAKQFYPVLPPRSIALTLQNGYGNEDIIKAVFGRDRTAAGVTSQGATFLGPGRIRHAGKGLTQLCMSDKRREPLIPLVDALNEAGIECKFEDNIENLIWSKLIINVGINAVTALTGLRNGRLPEIEGTWAVMEALVLEAVEVAKAKGITLTYDDPVAQVSGVAHKTGFNRSSMLQDFDRKSATEIDFINGAILREAEKLNIRVPVNAAVTDLIHAIEVKHGEEKAVDV